MTIRLGCIADDVTGATDLGNNLVRAGMRVEQWLGVPAAGADAGDVDAVVVALKSRTAPVALAVAESRAAAAWLRGHGAQQIYFKVCSTFDSTPTGNIGPVAEALAADCGARIVPVTPAFPENGRRVFMGQLFVGQQLLGESPMRAHPLTPMTQSDLARILEPQLAHGGAGRVGRVTWPTVARGGNAVREALARLADAGVGMAIVDAIDEQDLQHLAAAAHALPLVVASSGLAVALPAHWGFAPAATAARLPTPTGAAAVLAGSCSAATQAQVARFIADGGAAWALDPLRAAAGEDLAAAALAWATPRLGDAPVLIHATADAAAVRRVQQTLGVQAAGTLVEALLARIASGLVERGVRRLVVAGGETSGACMHALGLKRLRIGPQIDPGVPWCHAPERGLHLALKSGNFGGDDFFSRAFECLSEAAA